MQLLSFLQIVAAISTIMRYTRHPLTGISSTRILQEFIPVLKSFSPGDIDSRHDTIYGVTRDLRLAYFNEGWIRFASTGNAPREMITGEILGRHVLDGTDHSVRPYYVRLFRHAADHTDRHKTPTVHYYECPSPEEYRKFGMLIYPDKRDRGFLVVNSPVMSFPFSGDFADMHPDIARAYRQESGSVVQCSHCSRTQRADDENKWVWVPDLIGSSEHRVTHSLCSTCVTVFWN